MKSFKDIAKKIYLITQKINKEKILIYFLAFHNT